MATRANIIIKVPSEYKGQSINFDASKLHCIVGHGKYINNKWTATPHNIMPRPTLTITTDYLKIYNHSDGYPESLGEILYNHFTTAESVINLIAGGNICGIYDDYYNAWADNLPINNEEWHAEKTNIEPVLYEAFAYMWKDGVWYVKNWDYCHGERWRKLSTVLAKINRQTA